VLDSEEKNTKQYPNLCITQKQTIRQQPTREDHPAMTVVSTVLQYFRR